MVKLTGKRTGDLLLLANGLVLIVLLNVLASQYFFRFDNALQPRHRNLIQRLLPKQLNDLFGIELAGKRPEPGAGTSGQNNWLNSHVVL